MKNPNSKLALLFTALIFLNGCASTGGSRDANPDPFEPVNRRIYQVNDTLDKALLKPIATGYKAVAPSTVQDGVGNFFSNLNDVVVSVNDVLQFKMSQALADTGRLLVNSTVGLLGLVDVASRMGLSKHNEDFGQTLGHWGLDSGPYLVLPLFGPSDVRDAIGLVGDFALDLVGYVDPISARTSMVAVRTIETRAGLLDAEKVFQQAALDQYTFLRDAFLQRRRNLVYDGKPPLDSYEEFDESDDSKNAAPAAAPATAPDPAGDKPRTPADK